MQIIVLRNLESSKNRAGKFKPYPVGVKPIDLPRPTDQPDFLQNLMSSGPDCIIIDGGDGTVREVLTHLFNICGNELPFIGILANGNTNLIARNAGSIKSPALLSTLSELSTEQAHKIARSTPLLHLEFNNDGLVPLRGFMMGWGAYADATQLAVRESKHKGTRQVLTIFFKLLRRTVFESRDHGLRKGKPIDLKIDGQTPQEGSRFIGLATTLSGPLTAGLNPFWGEGTASIRWTDVLAPAPRLLTSALLAITGRHTKWMTRNNYLSGKANKIELIINSPLVLDGEVFSFDRQQRITISAKENARFISM